MKKFLLAAVFVCCATFVYANQQNTGCGLGTIIIPKADTTLMQVVVTCFNATSGNQSFGITSGTSNCSSPKSFAVNDEVQLFVENNIDTIMSDVAQGQGETISALASVLKVKDADAFASKLHANFASIFPTADVEATHVAEIITEISRS